MGEVHLTDDPVSLEGLPAALVRFTESVDTFYDETKRRETKWKILVIINTLVMIAVVVAALILVPLQRDNHKILVLVDQTVGPEGIRRQQAATNAVVDVIVQRTADEIERRLAARP